MKNRKVLNLRTHIAGVLSFTSYDHEKHKADMELTAVGVLVKAIDRPPRGVTEVNVLIPFGNIIEAALAPESVAEVQDIKRGPGRPPRETA